MANIITYQNRRRMPAETSGVPLSRWDIANLSEPQKAAAQFGETLSNISFDIAKKFKDAKDLTDVNAGEAQMHKSLISLYDQYSADPDYGTMIDRWNKDVDLTSKNILSNKGMSGTARKALEQQLKKISLDYMDNVTRLSRNKQDADGKDKHYAIVDALLQNYALNAEEPDSFQKNQDEIFKRIDADAMAGYIDNPELEKSKISKQMDVYKIDRYLNIDLAKAAIEVEKSKTLDPGEKNNYRNEIKVRQNQLLNKAEEQLKIQREKDRGELYDLLNEGVLTREKIESTSLDEDKQQKFWKMVVDETESKFNIEDYIEVEKAIRDESLTTDQVLEVFGKRIKGLDDTTRKALIPKILDSRNPDNLLNRPDVKRMSDVLKNYRDIGLIRPDKYKDEDVMAYKDITDSERIRETDYKWLKMQNQLEEHVINNPDEKPEQTKKWFEDELLKPQQEAAAKGLFSKMTKWIQPSFGTGYWTTEETGEKKIPEATKSPYPEYPDAFQENDIWYVLREGKRYRIED